MLSGLTYCAQLYMRSSFSTFAAGAALTEGAALGLPAADADGAADGAALALGAVDAPVPPVHAARAAAPPARPIAASALRRFTGFDSIRARSRSVTPLLLPSAERLPAPAGTDLRGFRRRGRGSPRPAT